MEEITMAFSDAVWKEIDLMTDAAAAAADTAAPRAAQARHQKQLRRRRKKAIFNFSQKLKKVV